MKQLRNLSKKGKYTVKMCGENRKTLVETLIKIGLTSYNSSNSVILEAIYLITLLF